MSAVQSVFSGTSTLYTFFMIPKCCKISNSMFDIIYLFIPPKCCPWISIYVYKHADSSSYFIENSIKPNGGKYLISSFEAFMSKSYFLMWYTCQIVICIYRSIVDALKVTEGNFLLNTDVMWKCTMLNDVYSIIDLFSFL